MLVATYIVLSRKGTNMITVFSFCFAMNKILRTLIAGVFIARNRKTTHQRYVTREQLNTQGNTYN